MVANLARLRACVRVARRTRESFSRNLGNGKGVSWSCYKERLWRERLGDARSGSEEEDHDERMGKADFAAVDGAVARGFDDGEDIMVFGVEDDGFGFCL